MLARAAPATETSDAGVVVTTITINARKSCAVPIRTPIHQPVGRITRQERDRAYARSRDRTSVVLYHSARWLRARASFLHGHPLCAECERNGMIRMATVVDHVEPHRGDAGVFWDESRWQALCASCHGRKTATRDGGFGNPRR